VLSSRYGRLDNAALLNALCPLAESARFRVGWFALSGESLHLRLVDPGLCREVLPTTGSWSACMSLTLRSGRRAVTMDALVFRLVCTNG
jgi:hypothetical protein